MAGDWIKMRTDLLTSPKVVRMASALKADRFRIAGGLLSVWSLFDAHSTDGILIGYTRETLDDLAAWPGFSAAMLSVGWLEESSGNLELPRFEDHNGASAKRRAQDSDRKKNVRKLSASEADKLRTREEKRREDKQQDQKTMSEAFSIFWKLYPKKVSKADALKAWGKVKPDLVPTIMQALAAHRLCEQWVKDDGQFIPNAATWLNKQKWEDEVKPYAAGANTGGNRKGGVSLVDQVRNHNAEQQRLRDIAHEPIPGTLEWDVEFERVDEADGKLVAPDD